jgi:hypothetical protein
MLRIALAAALLGTGCSTTIAVERPLAGERLAEINSMLAGRNATVTYTTPGGEPFKDIASAIMLAPERARWMAWDSDVGRAQGSPPGHVVEAPIDAVRKITLCDAGCHARGALEGAGFGLLAGLLVGAIGAATCHGEYCAYWYATGPILAIPVGALIGLAGHRTTIELAPPGP